MTDVAELLERLGGVAPARELLAAGASAAAIRAAWEAHRIHRPRKGWYTSVTLTPDARAAVRVGGRLSCFSAAVHRGLWVPPFTGLHVEVRATDARLRSPVSHRERLRDAGPDLAIAHWSPHVAGSRISAPAAVAFGHLFGCASSRDSFVVFESALRTAWLDEIERHIVIDAAPRRIRRLLARAGRTSDSGTESIIKLLLMRLGVAFVQQFVVPGVGAVDFLVGRRLVIEVDSREFHADHYRDRHRDAELGIRGFRVLRFTYRQIMYEIDRVERAIRAALERGDHR
ncbi:MAG: DUF559 domain-containing protein [Microbacteriaceae bacterium]